MLPTFSGSPLLTLATVYHYLTSRGCQGEAEHITIGTWPVQFLPANDGLEKEALEQAVETTVEGVRTWVMTAEHLIAIGLRTGRAKDYARILLLLESGSADQGRLSDVITRHELNPKWLHFEERYLEK